MARLRATTAITLCAASLFLFASPKAHALILIDDYMNDCEKAQIGVCNLSYQEFIALEDWINRNFVAKNTLQKPQELSMSENIGGGTHLLLSNGVLYEIKPEDINRSALWITPFPIHVNRTGDPVYPFELVNKQTKTKVRARLASPKPPMPMQTQPALPPMQTEPVEPPTAPSSP